MRCIKNPATDSVWERGRRNHASKKRLRELALPEPSAISSGLEFVAQRELHDARIREQAAVVAETPSATHTERARKEARLNIEADAVGNVENLPPELQALLFAPGHAPALGKAEIEPEEAVTPDDVPLSGLSRIGIVKRTDRRGPVGENVGPARIEIDAGVNRGNLVGIAFQLEIRRIVAGAIIHADGETAGQAE